MKGFPCGHDFQFIIVKCGKSDMQSYVNAVLQMLDDDKIIFSGSDDDFCVTDSSSSDEIEANIVTIDEMRNYENMHEVIFMYSSYSLPKMKITLVMTMMKLFMNNWQTRVEEDEVL